MARSLLAASPWAAQGLAAVFVVADGSAAGARPETSRRAGWPSAGGARERVLLGLVLAGAVLTRVLWWRAGLTAPYWFSETTPLYVRQGRWGRARLWAQWTRLLTHIRSPGRTSPRRSGRSAVLFQLGFGPSFHLPVLGGRVLRRRRGAARLGAKRSPRSASAQYAPSAQASSTAATP